MALVGKGQLRCACHNSRAGGNTNSAPKTSLPRQKKRPAPLHGNLLLADPLVPAMAQDAAADFSFDNKDPGRILGDEGQRVDAKPTQTNLLLNRDLDLDSSEEQRAEKIGDAVTPESLKKLRDVVVDAEGHPGALQPNCQSANETTPAGRAHLAELKLIARATQAHFIVLQEIWQASAESLEKHFPGGQRNRC